MLTISKELALAFETGTLARWKAELVAQLRRQFPEAAARFPDAALENWVREAMEGIRDMGATSRGDIELFTVTLFAVTEADQDERATDDLVAILIGEGTLASKMSLLRKGFARRDE